MRRFPVTIALRDAGHIPMSSTPDSQVSTLNEFQKRRLRVTCEHIDKLLSSVEDVLNQSSSKSAFQRYQSGIPPARQGTIEGYISRIRTQLLRILDGQNIPKVQPSISPMHAIHVALTFIEISAEELYPRYMRGYGAVPEAAEADLNGIVGELLGLVSKLDQYVAGAVGDDLKERLRSLEKTSNEMALLESIEEIVTRQGLVEYRSAIANILDRAEDKSFEIAVFGRVSSGKSSLLNAIVGTDVLPVGVTPVTAVPTHVTHGAQPNMRVWFAERSPQSMNPGRLSEFAAEQQNPGNAKHVTRIVVELPAARLRNGVTFVDTPGLGSLATRGAAETLAYLPKCDLGVVLIDAGSSLAPEDLQTLMALNEAGIRATVLLSKSDLLSESDRAVVMAYMGEHIRSECKLELPVHPVSALPASGSMLERWFEKEILPLYGRAQELRAASLKRKIGSLRDSLVASLQALLRRPGEEPLISLEKAREIETWLRIATGKIEAMLSKIVRETVRMPSDSRRLLEAASAELIESWSNGKNDVSSPERSARAMVINAIQTRVHKLQVEMRTLASELCAELRRSADALEILDGPDESEFMSLIRDLPVFDPPQWNVKITRPSFALFLGKRFAQKRLAYRLTRDTEPDVIAALDTYGCLARDRAEFIVKQLKVRFDSYADALRAQAGRASEQRLGTTVDEQQVLHDLQSLEANEPAGHGLQGSEAEFGVARESDS